MCSLVKTLNPSCRIASIHASIEPLLHNYQYEPNFLTYLQQQISVTYYLKHSMVMYLRQSSWLSSSSIINCTITCWSKPYCFLTSLSLNFRYNGKLLWYFNLYLLHLLMAYVKNIMESFLWLSKKSSTIVSLIWYLKLTCYSTGFDICFLCTITIAD